MGKPPTTRAISAQNRALAGAVVGFGDVHTRAYLYRSVIEGLGFALREGLEKIEKAGGTVVQSCNSVEPTAK